MPNIEQAVKDLQDAMLVIAEIEKRQSSLLREHSERIVSIERSLARSAQLNEEIREIQKHGDERLNALIAVADGIVRKPPPQ
jgi:phosphoribosyl-dephospho-CoA transferase